jgi:hypothetical protein
MRYIFLFIIAFILNGCSPKSLENTVENLFVASSGNKPPNNFKIANIETMRDYVFDMPDYTIALPSAKEEDFTLMNGWEGVTSYNKNMGVYLDNHGILYHIYVSTFIYKYKERERAVEYKDESYLKANMKNRINKKYDIEGNINVHYETQGKENYICIVKETKDNRKNEISKTYDCHKFNKKRAMAKGVVITFTYSKSIDYPKETSDLIKDYTYEDLQERAKRMLDSLYIKDGWDE